MSMRSVYQPPYQCFIYTISPKEGLLINAFYWINNLYLKSLRVAKKIPCLKRCKKKKKPPWDRIVFTFHIFLMYFPKDFFFLLFYNKSHMHKISIQISNFSLFFKDNTKLNWNFCLLIYFLLDCFLVRMPCRGIQRYNWNKSEEIWA